VPNLGGNGTILQKENPLRRSFSVALGTKEEGRTKGGFFVGMRKPEGVVKKGDGNAEKILWKKERQPLRDREEDRLETPGTDCRPAAEWETGGSLCRVWRGKNIGKNVGGATTVRGRENVKRTQVGGGTGEVAVRGVFYLGRGGTRL